jgi:pimeloyl-ACP methyl ester carboxylesterase
MAKSKEVVLEGIDHGYLRLRTKPTARLSVSFVPQREGDGGQPKRLLVFLSGIDNPKIIWQRVLKELLKVSRAKDFSLPPMLLYDRYGVGQSDPEPTDVGKPPEEFHDANESVRDLHQLITQMAEERLGCDSADLGKLRIVFCAHSLGACIARLYAQAFPGTVEGLLIMDAAISSTPAEKFIPDPDNPEE